MATNGLHMYSRPLDGRPRPATALAASVELPAGGINLRRYLEQIESELIQQALIRARGVIAHAAQMLGMGRTTLAEKLRRHHRMRNR